MSKSVGLIQAGFEPIPGYILRQRLGSGGYGEVWLADAPGGLQKAIKLVYGSMDEDRARGELRSLQRIRQVHHPFLLSLERIEEVNGQLIIVTELAESNMLERFQACRRKGMDGIPRDQLLDFMRDTADALDFISQKHDLQHLDVKPGNLLIVADRVKVADFGLIKDLRDQNQSLVGGLTPTYAAPEIFDGRPDRRSDQYSLAIVYQEMLTGRLPFAGRSAGELARQHVHQPPDLEALPPPDRPIVLRALAKQPRDRFSSCREFVEKLCQIGSRSTVQPIERTLDPTKAATVDGKSSSDPSAASQVESKRESSTDTASELRSAQILLSRLPAPDSAIGWQPARCLFIGLGGIGCQGLTSLRELMHRKVDSRLTASDHYWLGIDTDADSLERCLVDDCLGRLSPAESMLIPLYKAQEYRGREANRFAAISRRWMYNIPRSLATEGVRPLATLAMLDHYELIAKRLKAQLTELLRRAARDDEPLPTRIYIVSSAHGGTGSALVCEIAYLVRYLMGELDCEDYRLSGLITLATTVASKHSNLPSAAAVACLTELDEFMRPGTVHAPIHQSQIVSTSVSGQPFDWVTTLDGGLHGNAQDTANTIGAIAEALWIDSHTLFGQTFDQARLSIDREGDTPSTRGWLRAIRSSRLKLTTSSDPERLARWCCSVAFQNWTRYLVGRQPPTASAPTHNNTQLGSGSNSKLPLTLPVMQSLVARLLRELDVELVIREADGHQEVAQEAAESSSDSAEAWTRRIAEDQAIVHCQLAADLTLVRKWMEELVAKREYAWKQIERINLYLLERLMDASQCEFKELASFLAERLQRHVEPNDDIVGRGRGYFGLLAEATMGVFQLLKTQANDLAKQLQSWSNSLDAERQMRESNSDRADSSLLHLPLRWRHLSERVTSVLDAALHRILTRRCDESQPSSEVALVDKRKTDDNSRLFAALVNSPANLPAFLRLSNDLVTRFTKDMNFSEEDFQVLMQSDVAGQPLQNIGSFFPVLTVTGGKHRRALVLTSEQLESSMEGLEKTGLLDETTLIPATFGETPYIVCESAEVNLSGMVGGLWRPTPETFRLAERLHSRVDQPWPPTDSLVQPAVCV